MTQPNTLTVRPGQILGWRPARRHERAGRLYPIFAIGGASPDGDGAESGQQGGQSDGQTSSQSSEQNGSQGSESGQSAGAGNGQSSGHAGEQNSAQKVEELPDWAQRIVRDARSEAGTARTAKNAAEQKQTETLDAIAKALGLKKDETPDPAKLAEQLTTAQKDARDAQIELAVYRGAGKHQGDADALLDSRAFLADVRDLDPTAKDFAAKVDAAIKDAVTKNPKLKTVLAAGASSVDHSGGTGERRTGQPKSLSDAVAASYGA